MSGAQHTPGPSTVDYEQEFEAAMLARDEAGWLGTSPAETIRNLSIELHESRAERDRYRVALEGLLEGVYGDGYVLPAGALATARARRALALSDTPTVQS